MPDYIVDLTITYEVRVHVGDVDDEEAAADHAKDVWEMYLPNYPEVQVDQVIEDTHA